MTLGDAHTNRLRESPVVSVGGWAGDSGRAPRRAEGARCSSGGIINGSW